jgi:hypothetical protein
MMSLKADIFNRIRKRGKGYIFFPSDFNVLGEYKAVLLALHRLVREKLVIRLASGIYYYPKEDPELGLLLPSLEEIAYATAKHDHVKIRPTGAKALNELGLSSQVPVNVVFLTSGKSKKIKIGKNTITFRSEKGRRMALTKNTLGKLILGMQEVGKEHMDEKILSKIKTLISQFTTAEIQQQARKASPWVRDILINLIKTRT